MGGAGNGPEIWQDTAPVPYPTTLFKWIKQNLKIKAFLGTSKNVVLIQIWTALIAYLLLVWLKLRSTVGWGLLELSRLVQTMLMERCNLYAILCPRENPPENGQLPLFNFRAGN